MIDDSEIEELSIEELSAEERPKENSEDYFKKHLGLDDTTKNRFQVIKDYSNLNSIQICNLHTKTEGKYLIVVSFKQPGLEFKICNSELSKFTKLLSEILTSKRL